MGTELSLEYDADNDWIAGYYRGATDTTLVRDLIKQIIQLMEKHQCFKVLFDIRQALSISTTTNLVSLIADLKKLGLKEHYRWAVWYENDALMHETTNKMLQVSGIKNVLLSPEKEEIVKWLNISE